MKVSDEELKSKIENIIDFTSAYDELLCGAERDGKEAQSVISFMVDYIKDLKQQLTRER